MPHACRQSLCRALLFLACLSGALPSAQGAAPEPLPALNIDIAETSVSGLSSGAFMSVQFQVAYSSIVKGAGIIAGGPYFCSQGNPLRGTTQCSCTLDPGHEICNVSPTSAHVADLVSDTHRFASQGLIDDPTNVSRQRILVLAGAKDRTVPPKVADQLSDYYSQLAVPAPNRSDVRLSQAAHTMPTLNYGKGCDVAESPYMGKCRFDAAEAILNWIYGPLQKPKQGQVSDHLVQFDQTAYLPTGRFTWSSGMDRTGWVYIPGTCARGEPCRLHIVLHGCRQGQNYVPLRPAPGVGLYYGTTFVRNAGYNRWAERNHIVVLYPQAVSIPSTNPNGCWDWWGYTGDGFATRTGVQLKAIRAMVERLTAGRP